MIKIPSGKKDRKYIVLQEDKAVMGANWCVRCKKKEFAIYIFKGNSLCEKHFKKASKPPETYDPRPDW